MAKTPPIQSARSARLNASSCSSSRQQGPSGNTVRGRALASWGFPSIPSELLLELALVVERNAALDVSAVCPGADMQVLLSPGDMVMMSMSTSIRASGPFSTDGRMLFTYQFPSGNL